MLRRSGRRARVGEKLSSCMFVKSIPCRKPKSSGERALGAKCRACAGLRPQRENRLSGGFKWMGGSWLYSMTTKSAHCPNIDCRHQSLSSFWLFYAETFKKTHQGGGKVIGLYVCEEHSMQKTEKLRGTRIRSQASRLCQLASK
jgi:hypothetical protein